MSAAKRGRKVRSRNRRMKVFRKWAESVADSIETQRAAVKAFVAAFAHAEVKRRGLGK